MYRSLQNSGGSERMGSLGTTSRDSTRPHLVSCDYPHVVQETNTERFMENRPIEGTHLNKCLASIGGFIHALFVLSSRGPFFLSSQLLPVRLRLMLPLPVLLALSIFAVSAKSLPESPAPSSLSARSSLNNGLSPALLSLVKQRLAEHSTDTYVPYHIPLKRN